MANPVQTSVVKDGWRKIADNVQTTGGKIYVQDFNFTEQKRCYLDYRLHLGAAPTIVPTGTASTEILVKTEQVQIDANAALDIYFYSIGVDRKVVVAI
jgi:hypothetical protein